MAKEKFKRDIKSGEIKQGQCVYGIDEIGLILEYYGKDSEIYKAMANGENVSKLIEEFIKKQQKLLKICKEREVVVEQSKAL